jgi:hypothetical protein
MLFSRERPMIVPTMKIASCYPSTLLAT